MSKNKKSTKPNETDLKQKNQSDIRIGEIIQEPHSEIGTETDDLEPLLQSVEPVSVSESIQENRYKRPSIPEKNEPKTNRQNAFIIERNEVEVPKSRSTLKKKRSSSSSQINRMTSTVPIENVNELNTNVSDDKNKKKAVEEQPSKQERIADFLRRNGETKTLKNTQFVQYEKDVIALRNEIEKLESKKLPLLTKQASYLRKLKEIDENMLKTNSIINEKENELKKVLIKRETIKANLDVSVESLFNDSITISLPKTLRFDEALPVFTYLCSETLPEFDKDVFEAESSHSRLTCRNKLAAKSISTYPIMSVVDEKEKRIGDPICDQYSIFWNDNRTVFCLADGCNWGSRPREAARRASVGFTKFLKMHLDEGKCLSDIPRLLTNALAKAHNAILLKKEDIFEVGTTTLIGGILAPIVPTSASKSLRRYESGMNVHTIVDKSGVDINLLYALVFISIGDCKAFRFSSETHNVTDLTPSSREGNDPTDCGGRIGPYLERGLPDIRNLTIGCYPCKPNDIIIITSDGVHDNLDPYMRGINPDELSAEFSGLSWEQAELKDQSKLSTLRTQFMTNTLAELILSAYDENEKNNLPQRHHSFSPSVICDKILDYCIETTESTRDFFSNNNERLPKDYRKYPGKVDHTTCIVLRV